MHVFSAILGVAIAAVMALAAPVRAYTAQELSATFDPSDLVATEKRFLQFGLALDGHYAALIDGAWGSGSQRALEAWIRGVDMDMPIRNWQVVVLAMETAERIRSEGWEQRHFPRMDISLAMPTVWLREVPAVDGEISYAHKTSSLAYVLSAASLHPVSDIHALLLTAAASGSAPYTLRRDKVMITSVIKGDGTTLYLRSDLGRAGWSSVLLAAERQDRNLLYAVAGSITRGSAGRFELSANGEISEGMSAVATLLAEARPSGPRAYASLGAMPEDLSAPGAMPPQAVPAMPQMAGGERQSSGTAFYVSEQGHLLTNAHVVRGCASLTIDDRPVRVLATDESFDLALLQDIAHKGEAFAAFAAQP
ncbi:MAG: serine protease [Paracoccus sp. (in: a-proteobacteria)]